MQAKSTAIEELFTTIAHGEVVLPENEPSSNTSSTKVPPAPVSTPSVVPSSTLFDTPFPPKQMHLPVFYGIDIVGWFASAEQYFEIHPNQNSRFQWH